MDDEPPGRRRAIDWRRPRTLVALGTTLIVVLLAGGFYTHWYRPGWREISYASIRDTADLHVRASHLRDAQMVDLWQSLELGRFGRVLVVKPEWPRADDQRHCFLPSATRVDDVFVGNLGFKVEVTFQNAGPGTPWIMHAWFGDEQTPLQISTAEQGSDIEWGKPTHPSYDCPEFHIRLPKHVVVTGRVWFLGGFQDIGAFDSPAWKADQVRIHGPAHHPRRKKAAR